MAERIDIGTRVAGGRPLKDDEYINLHAFDFNKSTGIIKRISQTNDYYQIAIKTDHTLIDTSQTNSGDYKLSITEEYQSLAIRWQFAIDSIRSIKFSQDNNQDVYNILRRHIYLNNIADVCAPLIQVYRKIKVSNTGPYQFTQIPLLPPNMTTNLHLTQIRWEAADPNNPPENRYIYLQLNFGGTIPVSAIGIAVISIPLYSFGVILY